MKKLLVVVLVCILIGVGSGLTYGFDWPDSMPSYQFQMPTWGSSDSNTYVSNCCGCPPPPPPPPPQCEPTDFGIDIKYGSDPNSINLKSNGVVPVTVFNTETLDPSTVTFAGTTPIRYTREDKDGDGTADWVFHFKTQELDLYSGSTGTILTGESTDGEPFEGIDTVNIVPKGKKNK